MTDVLVSGVHVFDVLPLAMLGAVLGLDMVSFPQGMWSRPLVSATLAGAMAGSAAAGLLVGAVLELIALETLPFGAARYAEWGTAGTVGGVVYAAFPAPGSLAGALPVAVLCALVTAVASSQSMVLLRRANARVAHGWRGAVDAGAPGAVRAVQLRGLVLDLLRGFVVTATALLLFVPLAHQVVAAWEGGIVAARAIVTALAAMIAAGAVWTVFHGAARAGWLFLVGAAAGALLLVLG